MKKGIIWIFIQVIVVCCISTCLAQEVIRNIHNNSQTYAVIIGISQYENGQMPKLEFAHKDATIFADFLKSSKGGSIPVENIRLMTNKQADIASIHDALDWLKKQVQEYDQAYFYFSGHGDVETKKDKKLGYLLAYNSPPNNYPNNAISLKDINQDANFISLEKKGKMVLIVDACHSGVLAGDFFKGKQLVNKELQTILNNEVRLTACASNEEAAEGNNWGGGRGAFSYYLINGLQGLAERTQDKVIKLKELRLFMDSCFVNDPFLISQNHKQKPILDGNPTYPLAFDEGNGFSMFKADFHNTSKSNTPSSGGLLSFSKVELQPIDKFFNWLDSTSIEFKVDFEKYQPISLQNFTNGFLSDIIQINSQAYVMQIKNQILNNTPFQKRFTERFVQYAHKRGQKLINNYLAGKVEELRNRDYYNTNKNSHLKLLSMHKVALGLIPEEHHLANLMKINYNYLSGLIARIQLPLASNPDSLLNIAFQFQNEALKLEPFAAYIQNEQGILHSYKIDYNTAEKHFKLAAEIAPTWILPWSNLITVYFAQNNRAKALEAIQKTDELQPNLEYKEMNVGLVMELENNWLAAESNYQRAIEKNKEHYFSYERLGNVYLAMADFNKAQYYFEEAEKRKQGVNEVFFSVGVLQSPPSNRAFFDRAPVKQCDELIARIDAKRKEFKLFFDGFSAISYSGFTYDSLAIEQIKLGLEINPKMPLAKHILGKMLFHKNEWQPALDLILDAKKEYLNDDKLKKEFINILTIDPKSKSDSCVLDFFFYLQYEPLEDDYLLAEIYQNLGQYEKSIEQYKYIITIENYRHQKRVPFRDWEHSTQHLLGTFKLSKLYEKLNQFDLAENTLKQQIETNNLLDFGYDNSSNEGLYEIENNKIYEVTICDFYKRMIEKEPRNYQWYEKLGLLIYNRFNIPIDGYITYQNNKNSYQVFANLGLNNSKNVIGTNEEIRFTELINTQHVAYNNLEESIKLNGDEKPKVEILHALADLAIWFNNFNKAIDFHLQVLQQEENTVSRNNLIKIYNYKMRFPEALAQLKVLHAQNLLTNPQKLQLAQYLMLSDEDKEALSLLKTLDSLSFDNLYKNYQLYYNLNGNENKASRYLRKGLKKKYSDKMESSTKLEEILSKDEAVYIKARQLALMNRNEKALYWLKQSLDKELPFRKIIINDPAWNKLKTSAQWDKIVEELDNLKYLKGIKQN